MIEITHFKGTTNRLIKSVFEIRRKVFVVEQEVEEYEEFDEFEDSSIHFLANMNGVPVATSRMRETSEGIKLERFAVLQEYRSKGVGRQVLEETLKLAVTEKKVIYLNAQVSAAGFYKKNGFERDGDEFIECNILHFKMKYNTLK